MSTWNKNRFSVYSSEEKSVLGLIDELGGVTNENTLALENKTDLHGNHEGSWQGLSKPTLSEEGMRATVEQHEKEIVEINRKRDIKYILLSDFKTLQNTWDEAFQNALNKTVEMKGGTIFIDENCSLSKTFNFDVRYTRIESNYKKIKYNGVGFLFNTISSNIGTPYSQNYVIIKNLAFEGNEKGNSFIISDDKSESVGTSRYCIKNCAIYNFNKVFEIGKNMYLPKFDNCEIYDNNLCLSVLDSENSGENIVYDKCTIYNNANVFDINNQNCDVHVNLSSIDYNYNNITNIKKGRITIVNSHIEHSKEAFHGTKYPFIMENNNGNNLIISNSEIIFIGQNVMEYIFMNKNTFTKGGIFLDNNFMYGLETTSTFIGKGQLSITNTKSYDWENNSKFTSEEENLFEDYKFFNSNLNLNNIFINEDTQPIKEPHNGTNLIVSIQPGEGSNGGNPAMCITKKGGQQTKASVVITIPCNDNSLCASYFRVKSRGLQIIPTDIHLGFCKINKSGVAVKKFSSRSVQVPNSYIDIAMGAEMPRKCPNGYNNFCIIIDLYNAPISELCLDNFIITKM